MSDETPDKPEPLYPGWSTQQPPEQPQVPGQQGAGWQRQGASGWQSPGSAAEAPSNAPGGADAPGVGHPPPGTSPVPGGPSAQGQGWGTTSQWGWAAPKVKPGVIPLRPLGVGEILDGAVTTIRKNLGAMLGLSVAVAAIIQLGGLYFNWSLFNSLGQMADLPATATTDQVLGVMGDALSASLVYYGLDWLGRTLLTGILTVVVSRAVLGEHMAAGEAWRRARPRLLRVLGVTIVYTLLALAPLLVAGLVTVALAGAGGSAGAGLGVLLIIAAIPFSIWLFVRYLLAPPIVMIETVQPPNGGAVPIGIVAALRRSAELVKTSWWRVLGIYLLIALLAAVVANALSFVFSIPAGFADLGEISFGAILLLAIGGVLATAVTAPFVAAAVALLYVDRRIRAEGLDIELARAAGVTIPGRTRPSGSDSQPS